MKLKLICVLCLTAFNLFAGEELPQEINCTSNEFPIYMNKAGSTLNFKKYHLNSVYHEMELETLGKSEGIGMAAKANYHGVDVVYGSGNMKYSFNWYAGVSVGHVDPFAKASHVEISYVNFERTKRVTLAVYNYVEGSNAREMNVKFYYYQCE